VDSRWGLPLLDRGAPCDTAGRARRARSLPPLALRRVHQPPVHAGRLKIALLLAGALTVIRYWERPSFGRLLAARIVSGAATAARPGVTIIFLLALFVALAQSRRALVETVTRARLPLFAVLAALPTGLYYVYGAYLRDFLSGQSEGRTDPSLVATEWFWRGWWEMISIALPFPQRQAYLALVPLAAGLAGVLVARAGLPRATLVGLGVGYVAFAFTFTSHVASHDYYSLPLNPILALSIGTVAVSSRAARATGSGSCHPLRVFAFAVGVAAFKAHVVVTPPAPAHEIAEYQQIGKITRHTTLYVDVRLRSPVSYWVGWSDATGTRPRRHRTYRSPTIPSPPGSSPRT
jgi:hypothetical protein